MKNLWKNLAFKNIADLKIIDGDRGKNYPTNKDFSDLDYCLFLNAKNVTNNGFCFEKNSFISKQKDHLLGKGKLEREDIVLTTRGTVGNVAFYSNDIEYDNIRINSGMVILRCENKSLYNKYLYFILKSKKIQSQIKSIMTGSAQPQLPISILKEIKINLPPISEQKAIADVLSSFDDKIELNNKIIKNLEEQAKALYKHWFVDYKGKTEDVRLGEYFPVITGKQNVNCTCEDGRYPFYSCSKDVFRTNQYSFDNNAILVAGNGDFNVKAYIGKFEAYQRTYVLIPYNKKMFGTLFYIVKNSLNKITASFRGSVIKFITKGSLEDFLVKIPEDLENLNIVDFFNKNLTQVLELEKQNQKLEEMRDYLLPKLMNGKIKVKVN